MSFSEKDFSSSVLEALQSAGWSAARARDISDWVRELDGQGFNITDVAEAALSSFGGLSIDPIVRVGPNFHNDEPLTIDPILSGSGYHEMALDLSRELGGVWYPFGEWMSGSSVFIDQRGRMAAAGLDWIWGLGRSIVDGIEFALWPQRPLVCLSVLSPGVKPWPPTGGVDVDFDS